MMTISKRFTFDAAHSIPTMPEGHKCRGMHGHTYAVELVFEWRDDQFPWEVGFAIDYAEIERVWDAQVATAIDHKVLNEVIGLEVPTTEVLARWIWLRLHNDFNTPLYMSRMVSCVRVAESSTTWAEYRP